MTSEQERWDKWWTEIQAVVSGAEPNKYYARIAWIKQEEEVASLTAQLAAEREKVAKLEAEKEWTEALEELYIAFRDAPKEYDGRLYIYPASMVVAKYAVDKLAQLRSEVTNDRP